MKAVDIKVGMRVIFNYGHTTPFETTVREVAYGVGKVRITYDRSYGDETDSAVLDNDNDHYFSPVTHYRMTKESLTKLLRVAWMKGGVYYVGCLNGKPTDHETFPQWVEEYFKSQGL